MGIDFYRLKYGYVYNKIPRILKKHLKLKIPELVLCFDIILFFLRKHFLEHRELKILLFGELYVRQFKNIGSVARFKNSLYAKQVLNGRKINFLNKSTAYNSVLGLDEILKDIAKCLHITKLQASKIFQHFIYGIYQELLESGWVKLRNFGVFYIHQGKNSKKIKFRPKLSFRHEINGTEEEIATLTRVSRIIKYNGISNKILVKNKSTIV